MSEAYDWVLHFREDLHRSLLVLGYFTAIFLPISNTETMDARSASTINYRICNMGHLPYKICLDFAFLLTDISMYLKKRKENELINTFYHTWGLSLYPQWMPPQSLEPWTLQSPRGSTASGCCRYHRHWNKNNFLKNIYLFKFVNNEKVH